MDECKTHKDCENKFDDENFVCDIYRTHLARPGVNDLHLPQGKWIVRSKNHPVLSNNLEFLSNIVIERNEDLD